MLLSAWLKGPEDTTFLPGSSACLKGSFSMHYGSCSLTIKEKQGFRNQCWRRDWEKKETPQTVPGSEEKGSYVCVPEHRSCLALFCFNLLLASVRSIKGFFFFLNAVWSVNWVCKLGTDDKILWQMTALGWAKQGKVVPCVGVIAVLLRKEGVLWFYIGTGLIPQHGKVCKEVKSCFFPAHSRLNGLRWFRFRGEAREPGFVLLRGPSRGERAFVLELCHMCCVCFSGRSVTLRM